MRALAVIATCLLPLTALAQTPTATKQTAAPQSTEPASIATKQTAAPQSTAPVSIATKQTAAPQSTTPASNAITRSWAQQSTAPASIATTRSWAQQSPTSPTTTTAPSPPNKQPSAGSPASGMSPAAESSSSGSSSADSPATPAANMPPADPQALLPPLIKPDDSQAPARVDPLQLERAYSRARTARNVGLALAAPGVAMSILGGVVLIFTSRSQQIFTQSSQIIGGTIALAGGLALAVPGIYFWTTGQDDMDTVVWRRRQLTSSPP